MKYTDQGLVQELRMCYDRYHYDTIMQCFMKESINTMRAILKTWCDERFLLLKANDKL